MSESPQIKPVTDEEISARLPQVRYLAQRLKARLPHSVEVEDLVSVGVIGLYDAARLFDPARGFLFKTFCEMRVRGAMLDYLRSLDWAPRAARAQARAVESTRARLAQELGRFPSNGETAAALGMNDAEFGELLADIEAAKWDSLNDTDSGGPDDSAARKSAWTRAKKIPDSNSPDPFIACLSREMTQKAIHLLCARDREVVRLYYFEDLTMKEVADALGVTESRISQMHTAIIKKLQKRMATTTLPVAMSNS